jgi:sugar/nucleoside kinase (ribokinase family)
VTCGERGIWYTARNEAVRHFPAFAIKAVDTTGCGDVFHGACAVVLAEGLAVEERIRFASAAAALKATRHGGQEAIPTRAVVERFLRRAAQSS